MIENGVGTYRRLATKLKRDDKYLTGVLQFDEDDANDIVLAMKRLGYLSATELTVPIAESAISPPFEPPDISQPVMLQAAAGTSGNPKSPLSKKSSRRLPEQSVTSSQAKPAEKTSTAPIRSKEEMELLKKVSKVVLLAALYFYYFYLGICRFVKRNMATSVVLLILRMFIPRWLLLRILGICCSLMPKDRMHN